MNNIKNELKEFIKSKNKDKLTMDEAISRVSGDSFLYAFFINCSKSNGINPSGKYKYIMKVNSHHLWEADYICPSLRSLSVIETMDGDVFHIINDACLDITMLKVLKESNLNFISRKHPSLAKAMIKENFHLSNQTPELIYKNLMNISCVIRGKSIGELLLLVKTDHLKKKLIIIIRKLKKTSKINLSVIDFVEGMLPEDIYDFSEHLLEEQKLNIFIKTVFSKKHQDMLTNKSIDIIREVIREGKSVSEFKVSFSKKIAKYKTKESVENALNLYLQSLSGWNRVEWSEKLNSMGITYREIEENVFLFDVINYENLSKIGSRQWCIVTKKLYYNYYVTDVGYNRQLMVLDFNKTLDESYSMIGVTIDAFGNVSNAHDKNDCDMKNTNYLSRFKTHFYQEEKSILGTKISKKMVEKRGGSKEITESVVYCIDIFSELSKYGISEGDIYDNAKKGLIDYFYELKSLNYSKEKNTKCINNLIKIDKQKNGVLLSSISEVFNLLGEILPIEDFFDFNYYESQAYLMYETGDVFLKYFLKYVKGYSRWKIIFGHNEENSNYNYKMIKAVYEDNPDEFWFDASQHMDETTKERYGNLGETGFDFEIKASLETKMNFFFFKSNDVYRFLSNNGIPSSVLKSAIKGLKASESFGNSIADNLMAVKNIVFEFSKYEDVDKLSMISNILKDASGYLYNVRSLVEHSVLSESLLLEAIRDSSAREHDTKIINL